MDSGQSPGSPRRCPSPRSSRSFSTVWTGGKEQRKPGTIPCQEDLHRWRRNPCAFLLDGVTRHCPTPRARQQEGPESLSPAPTSPAPTPSAAVPRLLAPPGAGGYAPRVSLRDPRPCQIPGKPQRTAPSAGLPDRPCSPGEAVPSLRAVAT